MPVYHHFNTGPVRFLSQDQARTVVAVPKTFADALQLKLREGLPVPEAIRAARKQWPNLFDEYARSWGVRE